MEQSIDIGNLQQPINSPFNAASTAADVMKGINLSGKTAIVTGGNTGIGLETVKALAHAGASVIVPARDITKAQNNLQHIPGVEIEAMDLMDIDSIKSFAQKFLNSGRPLHLLINNAGIMWVPLRKNKKGIESQLMVNYLSAFQLCNKLWPALKAAKGARIVNVSSQGHQFAAFNFTDPNFATESYDSLKAYGQSKTALNIFTRALDLKAKQHAVRVFAVHPGSIAGTELAREASMDTFIKMGICDESGNILPEVAASLKSIPQGAATTLWCATSALLQNKGGIYCEDCNIAPLRFHHQPGPGIMPYALDQELFTPLWQLSEQLTETSFHLI